MTRVAVVILHAPPGPGAGPLTEAFATLRRSNADRQAAGFRAAGAAAVRIVDEPADGRAFGQRLRTAAAEAAADGSDGLVILGSGSIPLARTADRRAFVTAAAGAAGRVLANNRYSADVVAIAGLRPLAGLPDLTADNGLPRWLAEHGGYDVDDLRARWRLQVDLDTPLDGLIASPRDEAVLASALEATDRSISGVRDTLRRVAATTRDPAAELLVAGRASAAGLAWLERSTASRTRALIEERGFRTRPAGQRPVRSVLGRLLERDGPEAFGAIVAELGDAALVDSRVLMADRFGADERAWPVAEDRFASDLLLAERVTDPWLGALTRSARDASIPIVLGGHSLVGPGLRLILGRGRSWT